MTARNTRLILAALFAAVLTSVCADPPTVNYLFPPGGKRGSSLAVTAGGKFDPWPLQVWTDHTDLRFIAETNQGTFRVEIGTNAPLGAHLVRFFNQKGATAPRLFVVSSWEEIQETNGPSDQPHLAQSLELLPVVVNGRLEKNNDSDAFKIHLEKGQWLVAAVDGYRIDSPIDPILQLRDETGTPVALNHDRHHLDPLLAYHAVAAGDHTLQLFAFAYPPRSEINLTGSDSAVYRLAVSTGPYADFAFPAGIRQGAVTSLHLTGWNLGTAGRVRVRDIDATRLSPDAAEISLDDVGPVPLRLPVTHWPELREIEPNHAVDLAQLLPIPAVVNGKILPAGDLDRFRFAAKAQQRYRIRIESARFGFPLDPVLTIQNADGQEQARNDDAGGTPDGQIDWTAPSDSSFFVTVSDLLQRGGDEYVYRLELSQPIPSFHASAETHTLQVEPGKSVDLKVTVTRSNDFKQPIVILAQGLPEGVIATSAEVPPKGGDLKLTFTAAADAKPANGPIQILAIATDAPQAKVQPVKAPIKGQYTAAGHLHINETPQIWLTVLPGVVMPK